MALFPVSKPVRDRRKGNPDGSSGLALQVCPVLSQGPLPADLLPVTIDSLGLGLGAPIPALPMSFRTIGGPACLRFSPLTPARPLLRPRFPQLTPADPATAKASPPAAYMGELHGHAQLTLDKSTKARPWRGIFNKWMLGKSGTHGEQLNLDQSRTPWARTNSKWVMDLQVKL